MPIGYGNVPPFYTALPPANNSTTTTFTGGPWTYIRTHVDSSVETLATWRLDEDTSSDIQFKNGISSNAAFVPLIQCTGNSSNGGLFLVARKTTDSGTTPAMILDGRTAAGGALSTSAVAEFRNAGTVLSRLFPGGVWSLGSNTTSYARLGQKLETNTSAASGGAALNTWSATAAECSYLDFNRSKSATIGTHTIVASGDAVGYIPFRASDGSSFREAARIAVEVDGTPGASDMPGRIILSTTADGASSATERARITNAGDVGIGKTPTTGIILDVNGQLGLKSYTVATLPSAAVQAGAMVFASDAGGNGPCAVVSNGTNWKRSDNASTTVT